MYLTGSASFERLLEVIVLFNEGVVIGEYCEDARVNTLITGSFIPALRTISTLVSHVR